MTSTAATPIQALPRRIAPPLTEPPYDDEVVASSMVREPATSASSRPAVQGTLALASPVAAGVPAGDPEPKLRLVPTPAPRRNQGRPDPRIWAGRLAQAVTEVLAGDRPPTQLLRWTTERIYADLARQAAGRARELTVVRSGRTRPKVTRVVVCDVSDGVVEASAVISHGARTRAMALRLEALGDHWLCTVLQMP